MKRGATSYSGILLVDKPSGMSSHDVVDRIRRLTGERRVGHAGTLDPLATGLLIILIGPATRLSDYLIGHDKCYRAQVLFGVGTDTDDVKGRVIAASSCPEQLLDADWARQAVSQLVGEHQQVPPQYSAVKKDGKTAYAAARKGEKVDLAPRSIRIYQADLLESGTRDCPELNSDQGFELPEELVFWDLRLEVSKGTYIRSIARDLGAKLGTPACIASLTRVASGGLRIESALDIKGLEALSAWSEAGVLEDEQLEHLYADPVKALGFPALPIDEQTFSRVSNGSFLDLSEQGLGFMKVPALLSLLYQGRLVAIYQPDPSLGLSRCTPAAVFPGGIGGVRD